MRISAFLIKIIALVFLVHLLYLPVIFLFDSLLLQVVLFLIIELITIFLIIWFLSPLSQIINILKTYRQSNQISPIEIKGDADLELLAQSINFLTTSLTDFSKKVSLKEQNIFLEKNKYETIFNSVKEGILVLDYNKNIIMQNSSAQEITGYKSEELINQPMQEFIKFKNKDGFDIPLANFLVLPNGQGSINQNKSEIITLVGKNGKITEVELQSSRILSETTNNLYWTINLRDIEGQSQLQGIQLDFVSMASHELRTPLTSIIGYLSVYTDEFKDKLDPKQKEYLDRMMVSSKQLENLVENLLNVSKVERNAISVSAQSLDWVKTLNQVVEDNQLAAAQKHISLSLELQSPDLPKVLADNVRIVEVLTNLINNAINYTPEGGKITISADVSNNEVITCVEDNGVGIPKDAISHLFTKFFRVQGALDRSSNSKGTGLGLYLSKSIINLHHGRIWVESEVGKGSKFCFSLPISKPMANTINLTLPG